MNMAQKFVREFDLIERDSKNFVDSRIFYGWLERVRHAAPVWADIDCKSFDATEAYQFEDKSIVVVANPRQEWYPAKAYETNRYETKYAVLTA